MDWAQLNTDLLRLISKKLGDIGNFVRFRCVCKNWRLTIHLCDHPLQLPWLLTYDHITIDDEKLLPNYEYFCLQSNRTCAIRVPRAMHLTVFGQSKRYLIIVNYHTRTASFFNPVTGTQFDLPGIPHDTIKIGPRPIFVGRNPTEDGDIAIMRGIDIDRKTCICVISIQSDGKVVTKIVKIAEMHYERHYEATAAYHKGRLFCSYDRITKVFNVNNGEQILSIREPTFDKFKYLIEVRGDMLGVDTYQRRSAECEFAIYRFEEGGAEPRWVKTLDIGDNMLFLCDFHCFCLKASDYDGFTGNCMYLLKSNPVRDPDNCRHHDLVRYDLKNNNKQILPYKTYYPNMVWFVPCL